MMAARTEQRGQDMLLSALRYANAAAMMPAY